MKYGFGKNIFVLLLTAAVTLTGCSAGNSEKENESTGAPTADVTTAPDTTAAPENTAAPQKDVGNVMELTDKMAELEKMTAEDYVPESAIKTTVDVLSLGVVLNDITAAKENSDIINAAIYAAESGTKFVFPEGTVYMDASAGYGIIVTGKENIILQGNNTKIVNASYDGHNHDTEHYYYGNIFAVTLSTNVKIDGFTADFYRHTSADGVVTEISDGYTYFEVFDEYVSGWKDPLTGGEYIVSVSVAGDNYQPETEYWPENTVLEATDDPKIFKIKGEYGEADTIISARFSLGNYSTHEVMLLNAKNINIQNFTSLSSPAAVIYAGYRCSNLCITNFTVKTDDGSKAVFAANTDCMHLKSVTGKLYIADCSFTGLGDDALNISQVLAISTDRNENTLTIKEKSTMASMDPYYAEAGDVFEFIDPTTYESLGTAVLVSRDGDSYTFESLPEAAVNGVWIQNTALCPDTVVKNVTVKNGRARAFLIQTKNAALIGNNISNLRLSAILASPDFDYWSEAGYTENLLIKDNTISNVCTEDAYSDFGAIAILSCHDMPQDTVRPSKGHGSVYIEGNTITKCSVHVNFPG